jgi:hypothetical protein
MPNIKPNYASTFWQLNLPLLVVSSKTGMEAVQVLGVEVFSMASPIGLGSSLYRESL